MAKASKNIRLIARLDIKGENLIKGIHLEGLRIIGSPNEYDKKYYEQGADEIIYMDIVASLYGRSNLLDIVSRTAHDVFVPLTVGGGVRTVNDVEDLLRAGADKVAINSAAVKNPDLITEVSRKFGSQCMVLSIEAMRHEENKWEIYTDCGREKTGIDAIEWARNAAKLGAGELLVTSINQEGTRKGFDTQLINSIAKSVNIPIIASGGYGEPEHLNDVVESGADAVAFADALHFNRVTFDEIRRIGNTFNISTRIP